MTDVERVLPDLKYGATGTLWKTSMSGADLKKRWSIPLWQMDTADGSIIFLG